MRAFPFTRLLSWVALVRSTFDRLFCSGLGVMTMSMEELEVAMHTIASTGRGGDVVEFYQILALFKVRSRGIFTQSLVEA